MTTEATKVSRRPDERDHRRLAPENLPDPAVTDSQTEAPARFRGREWIRSARNYLLGSLALMGVIVVVGEATYTNGGGHFSGKIEPEVVQPYDTPTTIAQRAEKDAGVKLGSIDIRPVAERIQHEYGTISPGQSVAVEVAEPNRLYIPFSG